MAHIRPVAPAIESDRAAFRVSAELADQLRTAPAAALCFGEHGNRAVEADIQHVVIGAERREAAAVFEIGAKPADPGADRLAGLGMAANFTRQRKKFQSDTQI